ncbi:MAG: CRISPR-associated endonuclease Cas2 [Lactobacillaceae bacterium]|jgi:CRISPR-associated endonuclease Cas2|nr:CRISPR-associated endonuclease Cas2 [Lactobacillaceae bacterium]
MRILLSIDVQKQNTREQKRAVKFNQTLAELGFKPLHSTLYCLDFAENAKLKDIITQLDDTIPMHGKYVLWQVNNQLISNILLEKPASIVWI